MIHDVRWIDKDTGFFTYKRYKQKPAALRFAEKLNCDCEIISYNDIGEYVSEIRIFKEGQDEQRV